MTQPGRARWWLAAFVAGGLIPPAVAVAQPAAAPASLRAGRVSIGGGVTWTGGYDIGDATATLRGNAVGANAPPFVLFRAESSVERAAGAEARVSWALPRGFAIDGGVAYARPRVSTRISDDPERAAGATIDGERLAQYLFEVGATWQAPLSLARRRLRPFLTGGGGYLRQLYDERTLVETGRLLYAGAGARYFLRGGDGRRRALGLRGDARLVWRRDGVEFEGRTRRWPAVTLQFFAEM